MRELAALMSSSQYLKKVTGSFSFSAQKRRNAIKVLFLIGAKEFGRKCCRQRAGSLKYSIMKFLRRQFDENVLERTPSAYFLSYYFHCYGLRGYSICCECRFESKNIRIFRDNLTQLP